MARVIIARDLLTGAEVTFPSIADACAKGYVRQCIYDVLNGKQGSHSGKLWRYAYRGSRRDFLVEEGNVKSDS